jgi:subtilisin
MKSKYFGIIFLALLISLPLAGLNASASDAEFALMGKPVPIEVTIVTPADGSTVSGVTPIQVTTGNGATPEIYIDDVLVATAFTYDWDTTAYADGSHTIKAQLDRKNKDEATVTVDNVQDPDPTSDMPWWNDVIDAEVAHDAGITGKNTVVVVLDTGLGTNYVDLFPAENILTQHCYSYTKALRKDRVDWNQDTEGHGTSVVGTIIGYNLDLTGQYVQGVAPDAKIVAFRVLYWIGGVGPKGVSETEMLNNWGDAIYRAIDLSNGALSGMNMVISMSLGYTGTNSYLNGAVDAAEAAGVVVSTSAGNEGPSPDTTGYPANLADTTSVAAAGWTGFTDAYGIEGMFTDMPENDFGGLIIADFSSRGKVDVTGIGWNLVLPSTDGNYYYISGTSFSCPQVSGIFCLMFEVYGSASVSFLENTLMNSCVNMGAATTWGAGFVQADAAVGL